MPDPTTLEESLNREIGHLGFSAISVNGVIGAGIFALPAVAAAHSGLFSPWIFIICGVLILTIVLSVARAASFFSSTGGPIAYATHAFGPFAGFQAGWLLVLARVASTAANTNLMVTYGGWFWEPLADGAARVAAITIVMIALTVINTVGVRRSMFTLMLLTALKLIPLSLLIIVGISQVNPEMLVNAGIPAPSSLGEIILIVLYAYVGFEGTVVPAGEGQNARRDIPRAMVHTVAAITVFYVLIQMVALAILPDLGASETPLADVAAILLGPAGATLLTVGAVISIGGNVSGTFLSAPRMFYALARDKSLPQWFAVVHDKYRTPANSIIAFGVLGLALALSGTFIWLAVMSTMVRLATYALTIAAIPRLEKTIPEEDGQFQLPGGFVIPALGLLICAWLSSQASLNSWLAMLAFAVVGTLLYLFTRKREK
jgi:amino acid transporter